MFRNRTNPYVFFAHIIKTVPNLGNHRHIWSFTIVFPLFAKGPSYVKIIKSDCKYNLS